MGVKLFAAIDLGSFEVAMAIYEITGKGEIRMVDSVSHVVALGSDTYQNGLIKYESLEGLCSILTDFVRIMQGYRVETYKVYATSAFREAKNRVIIEDQIRVRTGLSTHVLSNSEQCFLSAKAVLLKEPKFHKIIEKNTALLEVGFGSSQISLYTGGSLRSTQKLALGALRMHATLDNLMHDGNYQMELALELVDKEMTTFRSYHLNEKDIKNIIAGGDCITLFAVRVMNHPENTGLCVPDFCRAVEEFMKKDPAAVIEEYDVPTQFAGLLLPALLIFYRFAKVCGAEMIWFPGGRLTDGMVLEYAEKQKLVKLAHDFTEDILSETRRISKRYHGNEQHNAFMETAVCGMFDAIRKNHGLGKRERLILQLSAILHDCGKFINMNDPGDSAYNIILSTEILGLSHMERVMLANIVRYNTMDVDFGDRVTLGLSEDVFKTTLKLTAILKLCDSLDRSHRQKMADAVYTVNNGELIISTKTSEDLTLEKGMFEGRARFFEEIYGIRPKIRQNIK